MFELSISKNEFLPALLAVAGAVDKRQSLPILSNILLTFGNGLELTATDLEIQMSAHLEASVNATGQLTLPAKKLIDIVRSLDADSLVMKKVDDVVVIKSGRSQFKLATLPADQFPQSDYQAPEVEFLFPRLSLIRLFEATHFAMSQQDVRVFLNGLLFEMEAQSVTCVATDGHRLALSKLPSDINLPFFQFLLPRKGVQEMLRLLQTIDDENINISAGKGHFRFVTPKFTFMTKLLEARFPPYRKAIPTDNDKFVLVERELLKRALSRIVILANEKSRAVLLHVQPGSLTLIANNHEKEEASEVIEAHVDGEPLKIGINANYLLDVLQYFPDAMVRLSMSGTDKSILVESLQQELYKYIIMPMKI